MKNKEKLLKVSAVILIVVLVICAIAGAFRQKNEKTDNVEEVEKVRTEEEQPLLEQEETKETLEVVEKSGEQESSDKEKSEESETDKTEKDVVEEETSKNDAEEVTIEQTEENLEEQEIVEQETSTEEITESEFQPIETSAGITILAVQNYSGKYIEDGSDEIVSDVMSLYIKNNGEKAIQLADFKVFDEAGKSYEFRLTTLLPNQEMIILEKNREKYDGEVKVVSAEIINLAVFTEYPSLQEDIFEISGKQNLITVTNISEEEILTARVCYKNISDDIYIGGITYTVSVPELSPGQSVELPTKHYMEDGSQVVFVTYAK